MGADGAHTEPYPDVVLPVMSLLELLRCIGKSLQSKWERKSEPEESERSQALPTPTWDHGCLPSTQHPPVWGIHSTLPCRQGGRNAGSSAWRRMSWAWGAGVPLLALTFPRARQCLQRNCCHVNSTRPEPPKLGSCWHYRQSQASTHLWYTARAEHRSL